ncbi:pyridoxal 5'-phosphate synthase glutaminase subunit PdxT [Inediibacterium massiliense]|uniref:pyridoxal 5'-phosphate synthase glutaminase subunit PdxT n=1 Tax=Inediibacterium massiliense TaxID=1658111 RepID=UPI0006B50D98|nr:pyridoxal 5'-phosphate synthase glutaminase subunit PdxT [Inediibacterium massiliense]
MIVGILALQGAFIEHANIFKKLNVNSILVKNKEDLEKINALIIPGGESTSIGKLLDAFHIKSSLEEKIKEGLPVWGTCAGMILLAKKILNDDRIHMPLIDITVIRNGYGRQLGSFCIHEKIKGIEKPFPMVFIRAPYIDEVGRDVEILGKVDEKIVAAKQNNILVTSFHPELTDDFRMHQYFLNMIKKR